MTWDSIEKISNVMSILGVGGLLSLAAAAIRMKNHSLYARKGFNALILLVKIGALIPIWLLGLRLAETPYSLILILAKGSAWPLWWEDGNELAHLAAYASTGLIVGFLLVLASLTLVTYSFYYPRAILSRLTGGAIKFDPKAYPRFAKLEILSALYGANSSFVDVTAFAKSMVEDGRIVVLSGNVLAGDPIWGVPKKLHVRLRYNGVEHAITADEGQELKFPPDQTA